MNRRHLILLVEDNPNDVLLTLRAFEQSQIAAEVVVAEDGEEALAFLFGTGADEPRDPTRVPDVVLLDLKLPKVEGIEVLRRLRANGRTRRLPVVILTSSDEESDIISSYDLGANSFVRKPLDFEAFAVAARQLGLYWLELNVAPPLGVSGLGV